MSKSTIFISHISEEKEIVIALKDFLEKKFLGMVNVFASSHEDSISLGDDWINVIKQSIKDCQLVIVICSPISVVRPWINFEAGAGWVKDIPVIPLCHSGITPSTLPIPINSFQGGLLDNYDDIKKLFNRIAKMLSINVPDIDDEDYFKTVTSFEKQISEGLLVKDTSFIFNLLFRSIHLIKHSLYASTLELSSINDISSREGDIINHKFTFNDTYNLFNVSLLMSYPYKKVFEVYYEAVCQLIENVKFVLSYKEINIAPSIREILNEMIFNATKVDDWFEQVGLMDRQIENNLRQFSIKLIKESSCPPKKEQGNIINIFISYYESLLTYQNLISRYENEINNILKFRT